MAPEDPDDDVPTDSDARKMSLVTVIAYGTTMGWSDIKPLELLNDVIGAPFCQLEKPP